jgi:UDP-glucose 4-epimerase
MRLLISGGFGYIGSHFVNEALTRGHRVGLIARGIPEHFQNLAARVETLLQDIREPWSFTPSSTYDCLIHLAAANDMDSLDPEEALRATALGTRHALAFCERQGIQRLILFSTTQVYGVATGEITETHPLAPVNDYGLTHWFAEEYVRSWSRNGVLDHVILRPANLFGAPLHRRVDRWSLVPGCFCREAQETGGITLRSSGRQRRDFINVLAVAGGTLDIAERFGRHANRTYNLSSGNTVTIREVAEMVARLYRQRYASECNVTCLSDDPTEAAAYRISPDALRTAGVDVMKYPSMEEEIIKTFTTLEE